MYLNPRLLHLVESGIVKYMLWENLPKAEICPQNLGGTERQLRNGDLLMTYQIMMAGFGTGVVVFFTEVQIDIFHGIIGAERAMLVYIRWDDGLYRY